MKKSAIVLIALLCMIMAVSLAACAASGPLEKPGNVAISGNVLSWDEVKNASAYIVELDGVEKETKNTSYTFKTDVVGTHNMRVKAKGEGEFSNSEYSAMFSFVVAQRLSAPVISKTVDGNNMTFTWNAVEHAAYYNIYIGINPNEVTPIKVEGTSFAIDITSDSYDDTGIYQIKVEAISTDDNYANSYESNILTYVNTKTVTTPEKFTFENGNFKWESTDEFATKFRIEAVNKADDSIVFSNETTGKSLNMANLRIDKAGDYDVTVYAYYSNGNRDVYLDSAKTTPIVIKVLKEVDKDSIKIDSTGDILSWDKVDGAKGYTIVADTTKGVSFNIDIADGNATSYNLAESIEFKKERRAYKVFTFKIIAKGDSSDINALSFDSVSSAMNKGQFYQYKAKKADYYETKEDKEVLKDALKDDFNKIFPEEVKTETEHYFAVKTYAEMMWALANAGTTEIRLMNNIDNISDTEFVSPITSFAGTFNGNNFVISRIIMTDAFTRDNISIFGNIGVGAIVKNVVLSNVNIAVKNKLDGGIVGNVNKGTIENIVVSGSLKMYNGGNGAGIVYDNKGTIKNVAVRTDEFQTQSTAGIAVVNNGVITGATVYGKLIGVGVAGNVEVGGIAAINNGIIASSASHAEALVNTADNAVVGVVGGLVATNNAKGKLSLSYATSGVTANCANEGVVSYAGGVVGRNLGAIENSYVDTQKSLKRQNTTPLAGGFAGLNEGNIVGGFSNINIPDSANENKAAFVAENNGTISNIAYNLGKAGSAPMIAKSGANGKIDEATAKGYANNEIEKSVEVLGAGYTTYEQLGKNPVLKDVIYVKNPNRINAVDRDVNLLSIGDYKLFYVNGEERVVEAELRTNKFPGYQLLKYTTNVAVGEDIKTIEYSRLVQVK